MLRNIAFLLFSTLFLLLACNEDTSSDDQPDNFLEWDYGKNSYQVDVSGHARNFHVHVPTSYNDNTPAPLVFMFHGSGGNGNNTYQNSGWKEVANEKGFICVFPTAMEYFVVELGRNQTKWSSEGLSTELEPGTEVVDDLPFVEMMIDQMLSSFTIDESRIYASGFSNGGGFTKSRLMCEKSDVFAAIGTAGGHGLPQFVEIQSSDLLSLHTIMGNQDDKKLKLAQQTTPFPMDGPSIMGHDYLRNSIDNILDMLQIDSVYNDQPEPPHFNTLTWGRSLSGNNNEFKMRMVNGMGHIWPSGNNHPSGLNAAEVFWAFFEEHPK